MSTKVTLYPAPKSVETASENPLPQLLHTPSGLALLELQGTINLPPPPSPVEDEVGSQQGAYETPIGRLVFPDYEPGEAGGGSWQKRVYLYAGKHQRLTGEVKKLPKAFAVVRRRAPSDANRATMNRGDDEQEELEIVEIVKWKIIFSQRPEPVGTHVPEI